MPLKLRNTPATRQTALQKILLALPFMLLSSIAWSQPKPGLLPADLERLVSGFIETETARLPGRVEFSLSLPDTQRLAPCTLAEPYLPAGARLWSRSMVGLRCKSGAPWNLLVPVQVRVWAPALLAARSLQTGEMPGDSDVRTEEIDLTRESGALSSLAEIGDGMLVRPITAGQVLKRDQFRGRPVVAQGDQVRIIYAGPGFRVASSGKALATAADGQNVRVQLDSGRMLTGTARQGRLVEVTL
jgi:flagella basal body P-ring formation protein FlgA